MIAIRYINTKFTKNAASKRVKTMPKPEKQPRNEKKSPNSIAVRGKVTIFATAKLCLTHNQQTN